MALTHFSLSGAVASPSSGSALAHPLLPSRSGCSFPVHPASHVFHQKRLAVAVRSIPPTSGGGGSSLATVGAVTDVTKDSFWPIVNSAGDKTVVLDMYTQWCGPCKVIAPKYQQLAEKYLDVVFLKLDCNKDNKSLAKELELKVVPTFKILKGGKIVKEVTGAKMDDLVLAIDTVRSS